MALFDVECSGFGAKAGPVRSDETAIAMLFPSVAGVGGSLLCISYSEVTSWVGIRSICSFGSPKIYFEVVVSIGSRIGSGNIPGFYQAVVKSSSGVEEAVGGIRW